MKSNVVLAVAAMVAIDASFMPSVLWAADEAAANSSYGELRAWLTPLGAVLVFLLGGWTERRKARLDFASSFNSKLREERIEEFSRLWRHMELLALYFPPEPVTGESLTRLGSDLRSWYFSKGGLYLTQRCREAYFALLWAITIVANGVEDPSRNMLRPGLQLNPSEAHEDEQRYGGFRAGDPLPADVGDPWMQYRFVRAIASRLRTALTVEVESRRVSLL